MVDLKQQYNKDSIYAMSVSPKINAAWGIDFLQYIGVVSQIRNRFYIWHRFQLLFSFIVSCWDKIRKFIRMLICSILSNMLRSKWWWSGTAHDLIIWKNKKYIFLLTTALTIRESRILPKDFFRCTTSLPFSSKIFRFAQPRAKTRRLTKPRGVYLHKLLLSCFQKSKKHRKCLITSCAFWKF